MTPIAIVMMLLFMAIIWGGLVFSLVRMNAMKETAAELYLLDHPEHDD